MTWEIFLGIISLVSFLIALVTPLMKLSKSMTELSVNVKNLNDSMDNFVINNTESHRRIWQHNEEQDAKMDNHENRITKIETKIDIMNH